MTRVCDGCGNVFCSCRLKVPELESAIAARDAEIALLQNAIGESNVALAEACIRQEMRIEELDAARADAARLRGALEEARTIIERYGPHPDMDCDICPAINRIGAALSAAVAPAGARREALLLGRAIRMVQNATAAELIAALDALDAPPEPAGDTERPCE